MRPRMSTLAEPVARTTARQAQAAWLRAVVAAAHSKPRSAILLGFCLLSFLLFLSTWISPFHRLIGAGGGDSVGSLWGLDWPVWAVTHGQNPLLSTYLNAPAGFNVLWTYPPLPGLVMAPVTLLGGPVLSYNLLLTLGLAGSAWCATLAVRRFVPSWGPAIAGGLVFGFGPYEIGHALGHVVLVLQFAPPLVLLIGHEALVRQTWRSWQTGLALGAVMAAQILVFVESVAIIAVVTAVALMAAWMVRDEGWRRRLPYAMRSLAVAIGVFAVVCVYPLWVMLLGPQHLGGGSLRPPGAFASNLANFIVPAPVQLIAPNHTLTPIAAPVFNNAPAEWNAYLGIPLIAALATVLFRGWRVGRTVRFLGLTMAAVAILTLGPVLWWAVDVQSTISLPARVFFGVPLLESVLWSRAAIMVDLIAAVLLAAYLAGRRGRPLLPRIAHRALVGLIALSLVPLLPFPTATAPTVPAFFTGTEVLRIPEGSTALVAPFTRDDRGVDPEYWQVSSGFRFRLTSGYVFVPGTSRPGNVLFTPLNTDMEAIALGARGAGLAAGDRPGLLMELTQDHVRTVIVGPMAHRDAMARFMTTLLGRPPVEDRGVEVWWKIG